MQATETLLQRFRQAYESGRMGHAYLFHGPEGVGKRALAIEAAKMLLCPSRGCGSCPVCRRVETRNHADFRLIEREEGSQDLKIGQIREMQGEIHLRPMEGRNKVFILADCDRMSEEAANCLLKTLEEPPGESFLFLLSETPEALPETIRSRCQEVRICARPAHEIAELLVTEAGMQEGEARFLARLAEGSLGRARRMKEGGILELKAWLLEGLKGLDGRRELQFAAELHGRIRSAADGLEAQREELRRYLELLNTFWRDRLYASLGLPEDYGFHRDEAARALYAALPMSPAQALAAVELSFQAEEWLRHNANLALVVENYVVELRRILNRAER
ncbi:MAG: DNA polymerase III subunit delta' [Planctomycetes bacterium]|nr:DNA polymerase III subunit delta' [Planctomycetota bacterium]